MKKLNRKQRRMLHRLWQCFLKAYTLFALASLFFFTPAWHHGYDNMPKVFVVINCAWLALVCAANLDF